MRSSWRFGCMTSAPNPHVIALVSEAREHLKRTIRLLIEPDPDQGELAFGLREECRRFADQLEHLEGNRLSGDQSERFVEMAGEVVAEDEEALDRALKKAQHLQAKELAA